MNVLKDAVFIYLVVVGMLAFLLLWFFGLPFIYDYRLVDSSVEILLFRLIPIRRILFRDIAEIRVVPWKELFSFPRSLPLYFSESWGNRLWRPAVLIRKSRGLSRYIILTPKDTNAFIRFVEEQRRKLSEGYGNTLKGNG